ncbi:unnamed protein product [Cunninghamella blakesleeana]
MEQKTLNHREAEGSLSTDVESINNNTCTINEKQLNVTDDENPVEEKEGGYGWFVILGAFFCQVTAMGIGSSWGK